MQRPFAIIAVCAAAASAAMAIYGFNRFSGETGSPVGAGSVSALEAAVERSPGNAEAWKALGRAHRAAGQPQAAVAAYVRAARLAPRDREVIAALRDLAGAAR
ncbi:tetratricopeptide repeat protein [Minwuia thermotolerans]|uniref:Uncharacterized protein n=1 Tax=Minwuia thermotolerans TaxID=2056226 RepID=A0A2M9G5J2_9PROT|nr:tetratricopeptide repeat protein [Minwuia thermotolerans]PJK30983.1 hypothetical protein CVT23_03720 [Minwuia thermotolerans]